MKNNIAFDLDGVLYNFVEPAYRELVMYHNVTTPMVEFWNNENTDNRQFSDEFWKEFLAIETLYSKSKALVDDVITVNKLAKIYNIFYITVRPDNCFLVTKNWLKREGFPDYNNLYLVQDKIPVLKEIRPIFFVEDRPKDEYKNYTEIILMKTSYNKHLWNSYRIINRISDIITGE